MEQTPQNTPFSWSTLLPVSLIASLIILLVLIINFRNYDDLKQANDSEAERRLKIRSEIHTLQTEIEKLKPENDSLKATVASLNDQKLAANVVIDRASALVQKIKQLEADENDLNQRVYEREKTYSVASGKLENAQKNLNEAEIKIRDAEAKSLVIQASLSELTVQEKSRKESIFNQDKVLATKNAEVSTRIAVVAGKDAEISAKTAHFEEISSQLKTALGRLANTKAEYDRLKEEIGLMNKERADLIELARIRSEKSDLAARIEGLKQDQRMIEGQIEERKQMKLTIEKEVAILSQTRNTLLAKPAGATTEQSKSIPTK